MIDCVSLISISHGVAGYYNDGSTLIPTAVVFVLSDNNLKKTAVKNRDELPIPTRRNDGRRGRSSSI